MTSHDDIGTRRHDVLDAYRSAARAEADSYFDDRALDAQRQKILARLEQAGQRAKVLPFPGALGTTRLGGTTSRRWVSMAAAAGLLVGLVTGQLLHVIPGTNSAHSDRRPFGQAVSAPRLALAPAVVQTSLDPDDALLDAIDAAVARHSVTDLRAFDDLTFSDSH